MSNRKYLQHNDRRRACPGLYRIVQSADGGICRVKLDLGRLTLQQMHVLASAAEKYGNGSIELTTRANVQLRGVAENNKQKLIDTLVGCGLGSLTKAGDDIRNIMVNPTAGFDRHGNAFIIKFAEKLSRRLQTSSDYRTLSPKFSFYIDGGETCAILNHINDIWLSITGDGKSFAFGIASCPTTDNSVYHPLGLVALARGEDVVTALLDCLLAAARQNSSIQRMKHFITAWGYERIAACLQQKIPDMSPACSFRRQSSSGRPDLGIHQTCFPDRYYLGIKPPLGRFTPQLLRNVADIAGRILRPQLLHITPWQGLIFPDCSHDEAETLTSACRNIGLVTDTENPYASILCCAGRPGCASALADVQTDARKLADTLPDKTILPVHFAACPKSCTATQAMPVTLLAVQPGFYDIYYEDKNPNSRFGRLAANKVAINDIAVILSAKTGMDFLQD